MVSFLVKITLKLVGFWWFRGVRPWSTGEVNPEYSLFRDSTGFTYSFLIRVELSSFGILVLHGQYPMDGVCGNVNC